MSLKKLKENTVLKGGTILDPVKRESYESHILIQNGFIEKIGDFDIPPSSEIIDCDGLIITHGFCDLHVHFREPGGEYKETLDTGSMSALAGGFTRVCAMPNTNPPLDSPEAIAFIQKRSKESPVHIHPIGAVTKMQNGKDITEMSLMYDSGAVAFSDDGIPIQDGLVMRNALEYSTMIGVPVINHAEDVCLRANGVMNEGAMSTHLGLTGNPDLAESAMVHRDLELAEFTNARLHVPHVSTAKAIGHIREMKKKYKNISAEVTPHHLFFNDDALKDYNTNLKVAPPIRTENDRKSLIKAVADGTIDCIATDHAPHSIDEKETTFDLACFGMIGLESAFGAANMVLVEESGLKIIDLISLLTVNPRKIMGFNSDLLNVGQLAELVVIDPNYEWIFQADNIYSKSENSPFIGKKLKGKIKLTISKKFVFGC